MELSSLPEALVLEILSRANIRQVNAFACTSKSNLRLVRYSVLSVRGTFPELCNAYASSVTALPGAKSVTDVWVPGSIAENELNALLRLFSSARRIHVDVLRIMRSVPPPRVLAVVSCATAIVPSGLFSPGMLPRCVVLVPHASEATLDMPEVVIAQSQPVHFLLSARVGGGRSVFVGIDAVSANESVVPRLQRMGVSIFDVGSAVGSRADAVAKALAQPKANTQRLCQRTVDAWDVLAATKAHMRQAFLFPYLDFNDAFYARILCGSADEARAALCAHRALCERNGLWTYFNFRHYLQRICDASVLDTPEEAKFAKSLPDFCTAPNRVDINKRALLRVISCGAPALLPPLKWHGVRVSDAFEGDDVVALLHIRDGAFESPPHPRVLEALRLACRIARREGPPSRALAECRKAVRL